MLGLNTSLPTFKENNMAKFVGDVIFGLALGIGFTIASNVFNFIAAMLQAGHGLH